VALVASTNRNGEVVYTPFENLQLTPKYLITDMIQIPKSGIIIPANTTQEIPFILNVPDEPFGGIVLGSVRVLRVLSEAEADASGVVNQYAYSIPIRLHQGDAEVEPDFYLDNVEAELVHFSSSIVCNVVNPKPRLIRGMSIVAKVYPEGSDTPILEYVNEDASMAPESVMPLTLKGEQKEGFAGGNYIAKITLQYEGEEWNLEKEFTITVEEATNINEKIIINDEATPLSAPVIPAATNGLIYVGAFIILAIIVALIILRKYIKRYKEMAAKLETMTESQTGTPASEGKNTESYDVKNE
jgi:hypothetical protein